MRANVLKLFDEAEIVKVGGTRSSFEVVYDELSGRQKAKIKEGIMVGASRRRDAGWACLRVF